MALGVVVEGSRSGRYLRTNSVNAGGLEAALIPASGQATHDTSVSSDTSASVMDFSQNIKRLSLWRSDSVYDCCV